MADLAELPPEDQEIARLTDVLSVGATFTVIEDAIHELDDCRFADEEIAVLQGFPDELRIALTAQLAQLVDALDDARHELAGRVMQLRGVGA